MPRRDSATTQSLLQTMITPPSTPSPLKRTVSSLISQETICLQQDNQDAREGSQKPHPVNIMRILRGVESGEARRPKQEAVHHRRLLEDLVSTDQDVYRFSSARSSCCLPLACSFNRGLQGPKLLAVGDEEGNLSLLDVAKGVRGEQEQGRMQWQAHGNAAFDVAWRPDDRKLATASGDQSIRVWDVETRNLTLLEGHNLSVKSASWHHSNEFVLVSTSRDGSIMIWDLRYSGSAKTGVMRHRPARVIKNAHLTCPKPKRRKEQASASVDHMQSVTTALFMPDGQTIASAGASDGLIKLWDLRDVRVNGHNPSPNPMALLRPDPTSQRRSRGIASLTLDARGSALVASSTDHRLYMYLCSQPHITQPIAQFSAPGFLNNSFYMKSTFSPDGRFIAAGSKNNHVFIWQVQNPSLPAIELAGHEGEVSCIAWDATNDSQLASCSDDGSVRLWRANRTAADYYRKTKEIFWGGVHVDDASIDNNNSRLNTFSWPSRDVFN